MLRVTYLELAEPARPPAVYFGSERVVRQSLQRETYLDLYRRIGKDLRWSSRLAMPAPELDALLAGAALHLYVLRDIAETALGLCEFDRRAFPEIQLTHFGLVPEARGRGLGSWLLATALQAEWRTNPDRIWLHTDTWDHPSARSVYERAGFRVFDEREEEAAGL